MATITIILITTATVIDFPSEPSWVFNCINYILVQYFVHIHLDFWARFVYLQFNSLILYVLI